MQFQNWSLRLSLNVILSITCRCFKCGSSKSCRVIEGAQTQVQRLYHSFLLNLISLNGRRRTLILTSIYHQCLCKEIWVWCVKGYCIHIYLRSVDYSWQAKWFWISIMWNVNELQVNKMCPMSLRGKCDPCQQGKLLVNL